MHMRAPLGNFTQLIYFLKGPRPPGLALPHSPSCPLTLGKADLRGTRGNFIHGPLPGHGRKHKVNVRSRGHAFKHVFQPHLVTGGI